MSYSENVHISIKCPIQKMYIIHIKCPIQKMYIEHMKCSTTPITIPLALSFGSLYYNAFCYFSKR